MSEFYVDNKLKSNYDEYYEGQSTWRWLSAIDKAANIVALCDKIPHNTVLDIGSGDGALLRVWPSLATILYTYHCAILCRSGRA